MANDEEDIDARLRAFEALVDARDPAQAAALEAMREHTRRLHQARGDWNRPSTFRCWNDPAPRATATAPLQIEHYREYKEHVARERELRALLGRSAPALEGRAAPAALEAPPAGGA
jgi:hypothetical protein